MQAQTHWNNELIRSLNKTNSSETSGQLEIFWCILFDFYNYDGQNMAADADDHDDVLMAMLFGNYHLSDRSIVAVHSLEICVAVASLDSKFVATKWTLRFHK